ncbi:DUF2285 domain-containing protein [Sinorhizobium medicae]|nr:DUF2285 domain-containing protein [Sinorhizobium medicae]
MGDVVIRVPIQDEPPQSAALTTYDREHLKDYLRLLDADAEGASWQEAASLILGLDPEKDPVRAQGIHASHLARAKWMTEHGYGALMRSSYH